ncbi:hypothetical protein [Paeniglutamicibacter antarcticus]|uniref:Uncharacterized protein n=1 Tax=Paeniglutamicibacter antarcticus TaxID=494023 RepID=A0ABP9TM60_9MICC
MTTDQELTDFICKNRTASRIYFMGIEAGYIQGFNAADRSAETEAEHAARIFYAMDAQEAHQRAAAKNAAEWVDVAQHRAQSAGGAH